MSSGRPAEVRKSRAIKTATHRVHGTSTASPPVNLVGPPPAGHRPACRLHCNGTGNCRRRITFARMTGKIRLGRAARLQSSPKVAHKPAPSLQAQPSAQISAWQIACQLRSRCAVGCPRHGDYMTSPCNLRWVGNPAILLYPAIGQTPRTRKGRFTFLSSETKQGF